MPISDKRLYHNKNSEVDNNFLQGLTGQAMDSEDIAVARFSELLALERGFSLAYSKMVRAAALLHDIGKQKISDAILSKPGKLSAGEFEIVKSHTAIGAAMMSGIHGDLGVMVRNTCLFHHEFMNKQGYWGICADDLPAYIPIISISDTFCALIHDRPYKAAWEWDKALQYISGQAGVQFNPALAGDFISLAKNTKNIRGLGI